ncbi:MAG: hypothetical protein H6740_25625 [Alphaproteobacteria bacterium]|nr:hypothetical protein [Alphaproteobacteria bacterium]
MSSGWNRFARAFGYDLNLKKNVDNGVIKQLEDAARVLAQVSPDEGEGYVQLAAQLREEMDDEQRTYNEGDYATKKKTLPRARRLEAQARLRLSKVKGLLKKARPSQLMEAEGGQAMLDVLMKEKSIRSSGRGHREDMAWAMEAIKLRCGLDTVEVPEGGHGGKSIKALYATLAGLPEDHVKNNQHLKKIVHVRAPEYSSGRGRAGDYTSSLKQVRLVVRDVAREPEHEADCEDCTDESMKPTGPIDGFLGSTVHEVGHSVDDDKKIMEGQRGRAKHTYGGWEEETLGSVAKAIGDGKGFFLAFVALPSAFLTELLKGVLGGKPAASFRKVLEERAGLGASLPSRHDLMSMAAIGAVDQKRREFQADERWPEPSERAKLLRTHQGALREACGAIEDKKLAASTEAAGGRVMEIILFEEKDLSAAIDQALAEYQKYATAAPAWDALAEHAAVELCTWVHEQGVKGGRGLYHKGKEAADKLRFGDRCYTLSNSGAWYSYHHPCRLQGVTNYQFNAPGEWFAELYSFYFAGKLPDSHPAVKGFLEALR